MIINERLRLGALAAWKAGMAILDIYATDFEVEYKNDSSPLTEADQRADKAIRNVLKADKAPIISEETKQVSYQDRKDWPAYWLVDPLDGTKEFINKNDEFTVNIAFIENGEPSLGVLYIPVAKTMYLADVAKKTVYQLSSSKNTKESDFDQLESLVQELEKPDNSDLKSIAVSRSHLDEETQKCVNALTASGDVQLNRVGSALKYAMLVTGEIQLYFRFSPTMEWDNAAGHALCLASGLTMCQLPNKETLQYNTEALYSPHFAAGTMLAVNTLLDNLFF